LEELSVAIQCPHCKHSITVKNAKPGRFAPKCPKCAKTFVLRVPEAIDSEWTVEAIAEAPKQSGAFDSASATGAPDPSAQLPSTRKTRAVPTSFDDSATTLDEQALTKKIAAADTEKLDALPGSLDDDDDDDQTALEE
jgi:predicted Zn finger-like uncharacterized protein